MLTIIYSERIIISLVLLLLELLKYFYLECYILMLIQVFRIYFFIESGDQIASEIY